MLGLDQWDRKALTALNARSLNSFLADRNWAVHSSAKGSRTWVQDVGEGDSIRVVRVPEDQELVDYQRMLWEAARAVARYYNIDVSELGELAASVNSDLFYIRVDKDSRDGTIPLKQAKSLLESIEKMVRGAAVATHSPWSSGRGKTSNAVREFLDTDVRMGHTKPGSFIITIAARLQQEELRTRPEPEPAAGADSYTGEWAAPEGGQIPSEPTLDFSRRVMTTLSKSLDASKRHLSSGNDFIGIDVAVDAGMNRTLIEAIQTIGSAEGVSQVDLTFNWAESLPQNEAVPNEISFTREEIGKIPRAMERLATAESVAQHRVIGPVVELKRGLARADEEDEGDVVMSAEIEGRVRRVTVSLSGTDYDWAIYAHQKHLPFVVLGELSKRKQSWWITRVDKVDTRELARHAKEGSQAYLTESPEEPGQ